MLLKIHIQEATLQHSSQEYSFGNNKYGVSKLVPNKGFCSNFSIKFWKGASTAVTMYSANIGVKNAYNAYKYGGPNAKYNASMQGSKAAGSILGSMACASIGQYVGGVIGACFGGAGAVPGAIIVNVV